MERQLKYFFKFLEDERKLSDNTLQSYKRDLKQFKKYLEDCEIHYNRVKKEDINDYIKDLQEQGKKPSSISRCSTDLWCALNIWHVATTACSALSCRS